MRFRTLTELGNLVDSLTVGWQLPTELFVSEREFVMYTHLLQEQVVEDWLNGTQDLLFRGVPLKIQPSSQELTDLKEITEELRDAATNSLRRLNMHAKVRIKVYENNQS